MFTSRYNDDLWAKFESAKLLPELPVTEVKEEVEARIGFWKALVREAESEAARPRGDARLRRFADASREALKAREALADALELHRTAKEWLARLPGNEADERP